jgi:hypothetical protein
MLLASLVSPTPAPAPVPTPEQLLRSHPGLAPLVDRAPELRIQVVIGTLEEDGDGRTRLVQHGFRLDAEYTYPASSVKLFAAIAALERTTELGVDRNTPIAIRPQFEETEARASDPSNLVGGVITVGHEVRKILLVSDNEAFNRLYELVGQDGIAASLERAGITRPRIVHRLAETRSPAENRSYPTFDFTLAPGKVLPVPARSSAPLAPAQLPPGTLVGSAYLDANNLKVDRPFDFTEKNFFPLADLQRGLCLALRPEVACGGRPFALTAADRSFLFDTAGELPRESTNPRYDPVAYPDNYVKPMLPGLARVVDPGRVRVRSKTGRAYGFSTENALVEDLTTGRSFFIAATIYTNANGVLNDDLYDYTTVAEPFFADLGEALARWFWNVPASPPEVTP